ncbi:uncharacterized protein [Neodiprion pinetum]|uniref:Uncharacterized protein LOC107219977 isoform X1 n=1 Tax=Neodiprion lecontei TaxID=441921 RepID=A0A6J0BJ88_NEOLC|nr:uncharacterized protein LOC107219977 isoform X1 [Neodiprion lecontei]XP_046490253.1 uncharacterized protein LOC124222857 isoform X1 [Neodiprion pinetum]XP_046627720.1 uncharacterized protein LOC124308751 isoform X1 [Neodiprion virginianus]
MWKLDWRIVLCVILVASQVKDASQVKITRHTVPDFVESGKEDFVILDCDYDLEKTPSEGLVVKWFRNEVELVYQWINARDEKDTDGWKKPQSVPPFDKYVDLRYKASEDKSKMWRAIKLRNPTPELTGNYTCTVFGVAGNEATSKKPMVVYSTGKNFSLIQSKKSVNGTEGVELTCFAEDLYPRPNLQIYVEGVEQIQRPEVTQSVDNMLYAISSRILLKDKDLPEEVTVGCNLTIPEARYSVSDDSVYYPGSPITTTTATTTLQRKMDIQASDNSQPDTVIGGGNAVSSIPNGLMILLVNTLVVCSSIF